MVKFQSIEVLTVPQHFLTLLVQFEYQILSDIHGLYPLGFEVYTRVRINQHADDVPRFP